MPTDPTFAAEGAREIWERHVAEDEPYLLAWFDHQVDGPYWRQGSVGGHRRPDRLPDVPHRWLARRLSEPADPAVRAADRAEAAAHRAVGPPLSRTRASRVRGSTTCATSSAGWTTGVAAATTGSWTSRRSSCSCRRPGRWRRTGWRAPGGGAPSPPGRRRARASAGSSLVRVGALSDGAPDGRPRPIRGSIASSSIRRSGSRRPVVGRRAVRAHRRPASGRGAVADLDERAPRRAAVDPRAGAGGAPRRLERRGPRRGGQPVRRGSRRRLAPRRQGHAQRHAPARR